MHQWYDRDGQPLTAWDAAGLLEDEAYKRVARSTVFEADDPNTCYDVSTVWLGLDHRVGDGPPLIFETMVFGEGSDEVYVDRYATYIDWGDGTPGTTSADEVDVDRYSTLAAADQGHRAMVDRIAADLRQPVVADLHDPTQDDAGDGRSIVIDPEVARRAVEQYEQMKNQHRREDD